MKTIGYTIIDHEARLLSRLGIKPVASGHELDISFERDFRLCLSAKKLKQAKQTFELLKGAFPNQQFHVVQLFRHRGQYVVDVPAEQRPAWLSKAVASLGGTFIA